MRLSILFVSLLSLVLMSCGGNKKTDNDAETNAATENATNELAGSDQVITEKYWKLIKLDGKDVVIDRKSTRLNSSHL